MLDGPAAITAIEAVRHACREHDGVDPLDEAATLRLRHHGLDGIGHWVDNRGFALRRGTELDLAVSPAHRGEGHGRALGILATTAPGALTAWSHGDHPAAGALAGRLGFTRERALWVMRRPTVVPLPEAGPVDGVRIRDFGDGDTDAVLAVNAAAFADHPEQGALDVAGFAERRAEAWFDPAGLLLAVEDDGELLGFHWTKQHDAATGEVYVVAVSPNAQGRGLGRLLTLAGLRHLTSRGVDEIHLYVESDNAAARRMYESLGFGHALADTHVQYRRADDPDIPA
ncbi:mycothiol synthase [Nocardioides caeni]|uniref:Mycothiol acetyltransferase n=2 Tax=Nocardioides caeni TaxID=574700 RepID=A0A4S8N0J0_9ACTN|nr:mycothiol synthase [Nocardioides caeni]